MIDPPELGTGDPECQTTPFGRPFVNVVWMIYSRYSCVSFPWIEPESFFLKPVPSFYSSLNDQT